MLSLQVARPSLRGTQTPSSAFSQPLDGLGVGADGKVAVYHMVQAFQQSFIHKVIEEFQLAAGSCSIT